MFRSRHHECVGVLGILMFLGGAAWSGAGEAPEAPVRIHVVSVALHPDGWQTVDGEKDAPLKMSFSVLMRTVAPLCLTNRRSRHRQFLSMTDSAGGGPVPVEFDMGKPEQYRIRDEVRALLQGKAEKLPSLGASWIRLKGTLRVPLARLEESPVYELPAVEGAERMIELPDVSGAHKERPADIVDGWRERLGKLSLISCDVRRRRGRKMVQVEMALKADSSVSPLDFQEFLIVRDGEKSVRTVTFFDALSLWNDGSWLCRGMTPRFEAPERMDKIRVKIIYRRPLGEVAVPVDMKIGLGGKSEPKD